MPKFTARVRKSGGSLIVAINKNASVVEDLKEGDYVEIEIKKVR